MKTAEIILAVISGVMGLVASFCAAQNKPRQAAAIGGIGLLICNIIWMMRIL